MRLFFRLLRMLFTKKGRSDLKSFFRAGSDMSRQMRKMYFAQENLKEFKRSILR